MSQPHRKKQRPLFSPDDVSTRLNRALQLDLGKANAVQSLLPPSIILAKDIQLRDFNKKYLPENCDISSLEQDCYKKYLAVNDSMLECNIRFLECYPSTPVNSGASQGLYLGPSIIQRDTSYQHKVLLRAQALIRQVLGAWSVEELFTNVRHSSGSSIGVPFIDTSVERKFTFPMSATKRMESIMNAYMVFDSQLKAAVYEYQTANPVAGMYKFVEGSRATTVRKTALKDRMIAVEPTVNMFFQQGLMAMLYERMRAFGLDVESLPDRHRMMARISSITHKHATIDWSSASDCLSIELIRFLFPAKWFNILERVRSPSIEIDGVWHETHMFSTMGNAGTFPLETLVFWAIGKAVTFTERNSTSIGLFLTREEILNPEVSVFGDDCILPNEYAHQYIDVLTRLGFFVNEDKSFFGTEGFRESCGGDYSAGYNVRPFCLKAPTTTRVASMEPWLYIIANALIPRYISYFGTLAWVYDKELLRTILGLFKEYKLKIKLVPPDFPDDAGLKVSFDLERFVGSYPESLDCFDKLARDRHGCYAFPYMSYRYFDEASERSNGIRLSLWHKKPRMSRIPEIKCQNDERRGGSYVVAKAYSSHWEVPFIRRAKLRM